MGTLSNAGSAFARAVNRRCRRAGDRAARRLVLLAVLFLAPVWVGSAALRPAWGAAQVPPNSAIAPAGSELRVMTFNLRFASAAPPYAWSERRPIMRALLQRHAPDLIGTQEGLFAQIKDLEADLPYYGWIGLGRDGGSRGEFMAVFYRKDRLEPLEFDHFWLSDTPNVIGSATWGNRIRRMVTWVRFRDRRGGQEFYVWNTHFDHRAQGAREKSAALLLQRVRGLRTALPIVLLGDFNAAAGANKTYDILVGADAFADTWNTAARRGERICTFHGYRKPSRLGRRIDWILTRGPVRALSTRIVTFCRGGRYPSDHFPVTARLQFGQPAP